MAQIDSKVQTIQPETEFDKVLEKNLGDYLMKLADIINGGIKFSDNFDAEIKTISDTGSANAEYTLAHTLKRTPTGYILLKTDKAVRVYDGTTAWTDTNIYLKFDTANCNVKLLIF